jgi:anti-sigma regulatory factor (Ser/Thr protein kinase)
MVPTASQELEILLPAAPSAVAAARRALASAVAVEPEQRHTLLLLASELVTNAVRHAGLGTRDLIRLRCRAGADMTRVEVCDAARSEQVPRRRAARPEALEVGGLGLGLVEALADRWGVDRRARETCVWFELAAAG